MEGLEMADINLEEEPKKAQQEKVETTEGNTTVMLQVAAEMEAFQERFEHKELEEIADLISTYNSLSVIVAGKPRMGKSTVFNNLFNLKLPADFGASSVTEVVMDKTLSHNGVRVHLVDVPGLQAFDKSNKKTISDLKAKTKEPGNHFTILYVVNVLTSFTNDDKEIVKQLTKHYGVDIWKKSILVLTFCDFVRPRYTEQKYKEFLMTFTRAFQDILKCSASCKLPVTLIHNLKEVERTPNESGACANPVPNISVVAIPVAESRKDGKEPNILPFELAGNLDWSDYAFMEILKKSGKLCPVLLQLRYNSAGLISWTSV